MPSACIGTSLIPPANLPAMAPLVFLVLHSSTAWQYLKRNQASLRKVPSQPFSALSQCLVLRTDLLDFVERRETKQAMFDLEKNLRDDAQSVSANKSSERLTALRSNFRWEPPRNRIPLARPTERRREYQAKHGTKVSCRNSLEQLDEWVVSGPRNPMTKISPKRWRRRSLPGKLYEESPLHVPCSGPEVFKTSSSRAGS